MRNADLDAAKQHADAFGHAPLDAVETIDDAADLVAQIDDLRQQLSVARDDVVAFLADTVPGDYNTEGSPLVAMIEVKPKARRTQWKHDEVYARVVALARDERRRDEDTGEPLETEGDAVARVLKDCLSLGWKVTGLRQYGLDPDAFCLEEWGVPSVKVTRR